VSQPYVPRARVPFEQRRSEVAHVDDQSIRPTRVTGFELTVGAGEATVNVDFPVWFVEKPSMSFGGEFEKNEYLVERRFPTVSVVVVEWKIALPDRPGGGWYVGAILATVTTGRREQRVWVHWQAEGKAIRNPSVHTGAI
jgi:hypothetical protein